MNRYTCWSFLPASHRRVWGVLVVAALCVGLTTCSRAGGKPEPAEPEVTVPPETVEQSLRAIIDGLVDPESLVAFDASHLPSDAPADDSSPIDPCPMTSVGDATDSDGDNYTVEETRSFDCDLLSESPLLPLTIHGAGRLMLTDKDDMDAVSGVTADATSEYEVSVQGDRLLRLHTRVSLDAAASDAGAHHKIEFDSRVTVEDPFGVRDSISDYDAELTGSFHAGAMSGGGTLTVEVQPADCAEVDEEVREDCEQQGGQAGETEFDVTSDLAYDAACPTFTGGSFSYRVSGEAGNVVMVSYRACGQSSVTVDGRPVTRAGG